MLRSGGAVKGRFWIGKWIIDLGALPALGRVLVRSSGGGVEGTGRRLECLWGVVGSCGGLVGGCFKVVRMLSASSPTSQELFGVVACC